MKLAPYIRQRSSKSFSVTYRGKEKAFRGTSKTDIKDRVNAWIAEQENDRHGLETPLKPHTVEEALNIYEEAAKHLKSWKSIRGRWKNWLLPKYRAVLMTKVDPHEVDVYFASLLKENGGPLDFGSVNHLRNHFRRLFTWAITKKRDIYRGENPISKTNTIELPDPDPVAIADTDLTAIIYAAPTEEDQVLLATAFITAMRKMELLGLRKDKVDLPRRCIWVPKSITKTRKSRPIPIPPELYPLLSDWMKRTPGEFMFPGPNGQPRTKEFKAAKMFRECMRRAGLIIGWRLECKKRPGGYAPGKRNGRAKLTPDQVEQVRARALAGEGPTAIGNEFGVTRRAVILIRNGTNWAGRTRGPRGGCGFKDEMETKPAPGRKCPQCSAKLRMRPVLPPYVFRHTRSTAITRIVESKGDLRGAQLIAGHASQETTGRNYAARRMGHLQGVMDGLPPVLNGLSKPAVNLPRTSSGLGTPVAVTARQRTRKRREKRLLAASRGDL